MNNRFTAWSKMISVELCKCLVQKPVIMCTPLKVSLSYTIKWNATVYTVIANCTMLHVAYARIVNYYYYDATRQDRKIIWVAFLVSRSGAETKVKFMKIIIVTRLNSSNRFVYCGMTIIFLSFCNHSAVCILFSWCISNVGFCLSHNWTLCLYSLFLEFQEVTARCYPKQWGYFEEAWHMLNCGQNFEP